MADPPLDYAYGLPDCVFALPPDRRSRRCSEDFAELDERRFVRALFPVRIARSEALAALLERGWTRDRYLAVASSLRA